MRIYYTYKDIETEDIRDIVHNNKLEIDIEYLVQEYIPYQVFITGRTVFKGLNIKFKPQYRSYDDKISSFSDSIDSYLKRRDFENDNFIAAVSGGVDSSLMALTLKPKVIYSGYYNDDNCNELPFSSLVAKTLQAKHYTYELNENDFLDGLDEFIENVCTPIAGYGGVMEYVTLKKALNDNKEAKYVLFGNGGDEIFFGYPFNYFIKEIYEYGNIPPVYMSNFAPQKKYIMSKAVDMLIVSSLNRSSSSEMYDSYATKHLLNSLNKFNDMKSKLLYANINVILPSLLHLNNQMCKAHNVTGLNPLSNKDLIRWSNEINNPITDIPKLYLRKLREDMPKPIVNNTIKRGFPIPLHKWESVRNVVKEYYDRFFDRGLTRKVREFDKLDRYSWGILQTEMVLEKNGV